ncbi:MAG TPA: hypothetical protein VFX49_01145 [Chloroflexota bacterium]|nr:hypothetical protein [Chloroflexota bacterium]
MVGLLSLPALGPPLAAHEALPGLDSPLPIAVGSGLAAGDDDDCMLDDDSLLDCEYESGLAAPMAVNVQADATPGTVGAAGASRDTADRTIVPTLAFNLDINGGYVAKGVAMRNRGFGQIGLSGIPSGASIVAAYLYWTILSPTPPPNIGTIYNGISTTNVFGALIGSGVDPCWNAGTGWAFRADVTNIVAAKKNGTYKLSNFPSGNVNGQDPFVSGSTPPMMEGASLVVVFSKAGYPLTRVQIYNGYEMTSGANLSLVANWGFPASSPVGEVRTTWIGADGQKPTNNEPGSRFNGVLMTKADWDGTDPQPPFANYSSGNLWDTDTISVGKYVAPGAFAATITTQGGPDCLVWVAQVLSHTHFGFLDSDGDSLLDGWEANGHNGFDLAKYGASPYKKDVFVEMDYMGAEAVCPCHLPLATDLSRIKSVFNALPVSNPNGTKGIYIHLDAGPARGSAFNLGGGNLVPHDNDLNPVDVEFAAIKAANFNAAQRADIFHYMVWAHGYNGGSSSGLSFGIPADSFIVTLGLWPGHGSSDQKVGTFIHELGHNLGLGHGGNVGTNYKPNYLSVMSYAFQVSGVPRTGTLAPYFGYSTADLPDLNEASLNESVGLNSTAANTYRTRWFCPSGALTTGPTTANGPTDWNCNGVIASPVARDANGDGVLSILTGWNDVANLVFNGGQVGPGSEPTPMRASLAELLDDELKLEDPH